LFTLPFVLLLVVQSLYGTAYSTCFILPKFLLEQWHASATLIGNANGAFALSGALSVPFVGPLLDRWGRRPVLLAGLCLAVVTFAPLGYLTTPSALYALRAVHGLVFSMVFSAGSAIAVDLAPPSRRAEAMGYFGTAMLATNGFGPTLAEQIALHFGWALVFVLCSLYSSGALLTALRLEVRQHVLAAGSSLSVPLSWPLAGAYLASIGIGIGVGVSKTFIPALMITEGASRVAPYFLAFTLGALVQRTVFGWVPDRVGRLRATVLALAFYALSLALMVVSNVWFIVLMSGFMGMAHGAAYPAATAMTLDLAKRSEHGRASAWATGLFNLGVAIAASGFARFETSIGYRGLIGLGAASILFIAYLTQRWASMSPVPVPDVPLS
jgi:MFS family permease